MSPCMKTAFIYITQRAGQYIYYSDTQSEVANSYLKEISKKRQKRVSLCIKTCFCSIQMIWQTKKVLKNKNRVELKIMSFLKLTAKTFHKKIQKKSDVLLTRQFKQT